jgi:hypothetical protein
VWEVEFTEQFEEWWDGLEEEEQEAIWAAVKILEEKGPALGRPLVDSVHQSRHSNMKELRPPSGNLRILFAFDPRRIGILLIGGDKTGRWQEWYDDAIPLADDLYEDHLREIEEEERDGKG